MNNTGKSHYNIKTSTKKGMINNEKMSRKNKKTNKLNDKGFITIEALLVIMVLLLFTFFVVDKVAKKLEIFGERELDGMRSVIGFADYGEDVNNYPENPKNEDKEEPKEEENKESPSDEDLKLQDEDYSILIKDTQKVDDIGSVDVTVTAEGLYEIIEIRLPNEIKVIGNTGTFKVDENGTYTVIAIDQKGKKRTKKIDVTKVDKEGPIIDLSREELNDGSMILYIHATDKSGVKEVTLPNGEVIKGDRASYAIKEEGIYKFKAVDNKGHFSEDEIQGTTSIFTYERTADGYAINGFSEFYDDNPIIEMPTKYQTKDVEVITEEAFRNKELKEVYLPAKLKLIKTAAFSGNKLNTIKMPDTLQTIEKEAFKNNLLYEVKLNKNLTTIKEAAFIGNVLDKELVLPTSLKTIEKAAFKGNKIEKIIFNNSALTRIEKEVFANNKLRELTNLPNGITVLAPYSFADNELINIELNNNLTHIENNVFENNKIENLKFGLNLTEIGIESFKNNYLTTIDFSPNILTLKHSAFKNNKLMGEIKMPLKLRTIENEVFYSEDNSLLKNRIKTIKFNDLITSIGEKAFADNGLRGTLVLPSSLTTIKKGAFASYRTDWGNRIENIEFKEGTRLKIVESEVFRGHQLKSLILPKSIEKIEEKAFYIHENLEGYENYSGIKILNFEQGSILKEIELAAFANSEAETIRLPKGLTTIREKAFKNNKHYQTYIPNTVSIIEKGALTSRIEDFHIFTIDKKWIENKTLAASIFFYRNNSLTESEQLALYKNEISLYSLWHDYYE